MSGFIKDNHGDYAYKDAALGGILKLAWARACDGAVWIECRGVPTIEIPKGEVDELIETIRKLSEYRGKCRTCGGTGNQP